MIPARFDWDDLGSWKSIYDRHPKDAMKNAVVVQNYMPKPLPIFVKTDSNKKVVISGLEDFIIVDTEEVLMICPMGKNQDVKDISVDALKSLTKEGLIFL